MFRIFGLTVLHCKPSYLERTRVLQNGTCLLVNFAFGVTSCQTRGIFSFRRIALKLTSIEKIHVYLYTDDITIEGSEIFFNFSFALVKFQNQEHNV